VTLRLACIHFSICDLAIRESLDEALHPLKATPLSFAVTFIHLDIGLHIEVLLLFGVIAS
jgi:hypothetical protein